MAYAMTDADNTYMGKPNFKVNNPQPYNGQAIDSSVMGPTITSQLSGLQNLQNASGLGNSSNIGNSTTSNPIQSALSGGANIGNTSVNNATINANDTSTAKSNNANDTNTGSPYDYTKDPNYINYQNQSKADQDTIAKLKADGQATQDQLTQSYQAARDAKIAAVRTAINASKSKFQDVIANAPQQFQSQRNSAAAQGDLDNLQLRRSLGNMGYTPNEDLSTIREGANNNNVHSQLNQLDIAQTKTIQDANNAIANLEAQGSTEEASTIYDYATKSLNAINTQRNQLQQTLQTANQNYTNDLKGLLDYSSQQQTKKDNATQLALTNKMKSLNDQGKTLDENGNVVDTAATTQTNLQNDRIAKQDQTIADNKLKNDYISSITNRGDTMDYQAEINNIKNDGDPSNDWKLAPLAEQQTLKKNAMLKNSLDTIGQYANNYQAEIDKRQPNDPLVPYLKVAQAQKIATMNASKLSAQEKQVKQAFDNFKQMGYATAPVAQILGIPEGSKTMDYIKTQNESAKTQYDINKPYYNPDSGTKQTATDRTNEKNSNMASDIATIQSYPVKSAVQILNDRKEQLIGAYGIDGYNQIWNSALDWSIKNGEIAKR